MFLFNLGNAPCSHYWGSKPQFIIRISPLPVSAEIVVAQLAAIPTVVLAGRLASLGRRPIFILGFLTVPVRAYLYSLTTNFYELILIQVLDGFSAGIFRRFIHDNSWGSYPRDRAL